MEEKLAKLAAHAIAVQDACNLSGVVHAFSRAMTALCEMGLDTDARKHCNPIAILFSSKIASLTGSESGVCFRRHTTGPSNTASETRGRHTNVTVCMSERVLTVRHEGRKVYV